MCIRDSLGGQRHQLAIYRDGLGAVVQLDAADDETGRAHRACPQLEIPPQLTADSGQYLHRIKGLGDVVIRTDIQPEDLRCV